MTSTGKKKKNVTEPKQLSLFQMFSEYGTYRFTRDNDKKKIFNWVDDCEQKRTSILFNN